MLVYCCSDPNIKNRWQDAVNLFPDVVATDAVGDAELHFITQAKHELYLLHLDLLSSPQERIEYVRHFRECFTAVKIIAFANVPDEDEGLALLKLGAQGYCNANIVPSLMSKAIVAVKQGEIWVGRMLMQKIITDMVGVAQKNEPDLSMLTGREQEIARVVAEGACNKTIANRLDVTERTVKAHLTNIFKKAGVRDRLELALMVNGQR